MSKYNKNFNFGILVYNNDCHKNASHNIGDYIQSLAAINIYKKIVEERNDRQYKIDSFLDGVISNTIPNFNFIFIKRDQLSETPQYRGYKDVVTIMNGWWLHPYKKNGKISFQIPDNLNPIFVSFHIANHKLYKGKYLKELKKHEPIGCRDIKTTETLNYLGVKAYFSGCLTTTIDFYKWDERGDKIYAVDTLDKKEPGTIPIVHNDHEIKNAHHKYGLKEALKLLRTYSTAKKVYTSRLHCYLPCLAMSTPVEFVSPSGKTDEKTWGTKNRFDGLRELSENSLLYEMQTTLTKDVMSKIKGAIND